MDKHERALEETKRKIKIKKILVGLKNYGYIHNLEESYVVKDKVKAIKIKTYNKFKSDLQDMLREPMSYSQRDIDEINNKVKDFKYPDRTFI